MKTWIDAVQLHETASHQPRAAHQHQGYRYLGDHQCTAENATACNGSSGVAESMGWILEIGDAVQARRRT